MICQSLQVRQGVAEYKGGVTYHPQLRLHKEFTRLSDGQKNRIYKKLLRTDHPMGSRKQKEDKSHINSQYGLWGGICTDGNQEMRKEIIRIGQASVPGSQAGTVYSRGGA